MLVPAQFDEAGVRGLPFLSMQLPCNVAAWARLRRFILSFKDFDLRRVTALLASLFGAFLIFFVFVVISVFVAFTSVNGKIFVAMTVYLLLFIGVYLAYPLLWRGLSINNIQYEMVFTLAALKWEGARACQLYESSHHTRQLDDNDPIVSRLPQDPALLHVAMGDAHALHEEQPLSEFELKHADELRKAHQLVRDAYDWLTNIDWTFRIAGVPVNGALLTSVASATVASLLSWIVSQVYVRK